MKQRYNIVEKFEIVISQKIKSEMHIDEYDVYQGFKKTIKTRLNILILFQD